MQNSSQPSSEAWASVYTGCFRKLTQAEGEAFENEIRAHVKNPEPAEMIRAVRELARDKNTGRIKHAPSGWDIASKIRFLRGADYRERGEDGMDCFCCDGWQYVYPRVGRYAFGLVAVPCVCAKGIKHRARYKRDHNAEFDAMIKTANRENLNFTEAYTGKDPKRNMVLMMLDSAAAKYMDEPCTSEEGLASVKALADDIAAGRFNESEEWENRMNRAKNISEEIRIKELAKAKTSKPPPPPDSGTEDFEKTFPASFVDTDPCPFGEGGRR